MTKYADESEVFDTAPQLAKPDSFGKRFVTGLVDPIMGVGQIADKLVVNPIRQAIFPGATSMDDVIRQREANYNAPEGVDWARMGGNVANPMTLLGPGKGKSILTRTLAARAATGGAVQGILAPSTSVDDYWQEKLTGAALGGVVGGTVGKLTGGLVTPTPAARELMDRGVALTPGQAAGVGSGWSKAEQALSSLPVASTAIRGAQRRGVEEANVAAAKSVAGLVKKNVKLGLPPREAIEQTRELISKTYDDALGGASTYTHGVKDYVAGTLPDIVDNNPMMTAKEMKRLNGYVEDRFGSLIKNGHLEMTGDQLKQIDSEIGGQIRRLQSSTNAADKTAAPAWRQLQNSVREAMEAALADTPGAYEQLKRANAAYRQLLALEKAMLPGADVFTPRRLKMTLDKMGIKGTDLNKVADSMDSTLPNTVPDSGTAERLIAGALPAALMGGGYGAQEAGFNTIGGGMMAAGALGTRTGSRLLTGNTVVQQILGTRSPAFARALAAALRGTPDKPEDMTGYATDDEVFQ